jgi:hypothetical protein
MRTLVTFESSAFNARESKDYFINPGCFGDDLARWLIAALRRAGLATDDEPSQEDFGWYFEFKVPEGEHCIVVGLRPGDPEPQDCWIAWLERSRGFLGSVFGGRQRGIAPSAAAALHAALQAPEIRNVRWHEKKDFDAMREERGADAP